MKNTLLIMTAWSKFKIAFRGQRSYLSILITVILLCSCAPKESNSIKNQNVGAALGTSYSVIYISDQQLDYQVEIDSVFDVINQSLSTYIATSDISKINRGDTTVVVDHMFREVFELSKEIHQQTKGYFDPTVGTLVNAWGFGPGMQMQLDSARVDSLMQYVGFDKVSLLSDGRIEKTKREIQFDFNAIAKGYAIDRLAKMMDAKGIQNYLLEVGGELVAKGKNTVAKRPWGVYVQDPQAEQAKTAIRLTNSAMASSGNYRHFRIDEITGAKYVHTINPKTGYSENGSTLGVNVIAATCAEADAYATAFMAMDLYNVFNILTGDKNIDGYIIFLDEQGQTQEFMTAGFKELILK